ncbi:hypothetical protein LPJ38_36425 [Bradyrhizobium daqingense]|uniref:hypothetical protein n=1 Tax=Bradyrhizobium daqingense TaxID=993502 RepID=UPI001E283184|nr:hypothetical protein [Bradyrhizobium daqingense]UFS93037.1 hypothetical protein LPJ38_36425 [Bradyrhizobium daqingense]
MAVNPLVRPAPFPLKGPPGRFHGDHVRTEVGEKLHADRTHQKVIEAEDSNALQKIDHTSLLSVLPEIEVLVLDF